MCSTSRRPSDPTRFGGNGDGYPTPMEMKAYPLLGDFSDRELDVLKLHGVLTYPQWPRRLIEVSQRVDRGWAVAVPPEAVHFLCTRHKLYITDLCRPLLGFEMLSLQSFVFPEPELSVRFQDVLLKDLSGNAFEASCCSAVLFCILRFALARRRGTRLVQSGVAQHARPGFFGR